MKKILALTFLLIPPIAVAETSGELTDTSKMCIADLEKIMSNVNSSYATEDEMLIDCEKGDIVIFLGSTRTTLAMARACDFSYAIPNNRACVYRGSLRNHTMDRKIFKKKYNSRTVE